MLPTFEHFDLFLQRRGKDLAKRPLANNTHAVRECDGSIAIRLHSTNVVTYFTDGRVIYRTGGWDTDTTKARINSFGPFKLQGSTRGQHAGEWMVQLRGEWHPFRRYEEFPPEEMLFARTMAASGTTHSDLAEASEELPPCIQAMGCYCAGHARGNPSSDPCDTSEE